MMCQDRDNLDNSVISRDRGQRGLYGEYNVVLGLCAITMWYVGNMNVVPTRSSYP